MFEAILLLVGVKWAYIRPHVNLWAAHRWRVGIFVIAIAIHYWLGGLLTAEALGWIPEGSASKTSPVNGVIELFGLTWSGPVLISAAILAHAGLFINGRAAWYWRLTLMLWQQFVITVTVIDILDIIIRGQYADGYVPAVGPQWFIAADQGDGTLIIGILHSVALLHFILFVLLKGKDGTNP